MNGQHGTGPHAYAAELAAETARALGGGHGPDPATARSAVTESGIEVHGFRIAVDRARAARDYWRERHADSGWYPFLGNYGPQDCAARNAALPAGEQGGWSALDAALAVPPGRATAELVARTLRAGTERYTPPREEPHQEYLEEWLDLLDPARVEAALAPAPATPVTERPGSADAWRFTDGEYWLCLVPAGAGYELPVLLPGLLTNCELPPAEQLGVLRDWYDRWGAEFYFVNSANLELTVRRPPVLPAEVARVAVEQYCFCPDTVQDTVAAANGPVRGDHWSFWWD